MCIIVCSVGSVRAREHIHHVGIHHVRLRISIFGVNITRLWYSHLDLWITSTSDSVRERISIRGVVIAIWALDRLRNTVHRSVDSELRSITRVWYSHLDLKQTCATPVLLFGGVGPALLVEMSLALLQSPLELSSEKPLMAMRLQAIATG